MRNGPTCERATTRAARFVDTTHPSGSAARPPVTPPTLSSIVRSAPVRTPPAGPRRWGATEARPTSCSSSTSRIATPMYRPT